MVVVANSSIFGGGPYSVAGANQLRVVGRRRWPVSMIRIQAPAKGGQRGKDGIFRRPRTLPFMPKSIRDPYHPSGNSLCFMIQTAHLMGCNPIYCLGFTLASGTGYFFGLENPVTKRRALYDDGRALEWLTWYQSKHPGRARLWPGWSGPVYNVLEVVDEQEASRLAGGQTAERGGDQPEAVGRSDEAVE